MFDYPTLTEFTTYVMTLIPKDLVLEEDTSKDETPILSSIPEENDIAIIGMSCRFPGGCNTPEEFWEFLSKGGDGIVDMPKERWDVNRYYDKNPEALGKMYVQKGGFISQKINEFDAKFFGISPTEAIDLDPQQRLLLELSWEAFENANYDPSRLAGTKTGVFVGISIPEYYYLDRAKKHHDYTKFSAYSATGIITSWPRVALRISLVCRVPLSASIRPVLPPWSVRIWPVRVFDWESAKWLWRLELI